MSNRSLMTTRGAEILRKSLEEKKKKSEVLRQAIETARGWGDLKENAEYSSARSERDLLMQTMQAIESRLRNSQIIDPKQLVNTGKVVFGTTVHLINTIDSEHMIFQIVGEDEADFKSGKISLDSPIAQALIGKSSGETVDVSTLEGKKSFKIEKVEYI